MQLYKERLKIIIFDGTFKTTPFVNRLLEGLVQQHEIYVLGFNEELTNPIKGVNYMALGSNQSKFKFIKTSLVIGWKEKNISLLASIGSMLIKGKRHELQQQNLNLEIKHINPDIIHVQWPSLLTWFEDEILKQDVPIVLSQRGYHSNVRPFIDIENRKYLKQWYPKISGFHSVSQAISNKGDEIYKSVSKINKVVYTGLDLTTLAFEETYHKPQTLTLLSVGRPHWIKNYAEVLYALHKLKASNVAFKYKIIGGEANEELQYLIHDLDLGNEVQLTPRLTQEKVYELMQESSLLIMSSLAEGVPNVVVEAMAIGLPVLSTACGGVEELIKDNENGWLVPTRSPESLAEAINDFDKLTVEQIKLMRMLARKKVELQHSEPQMLIDMEKLYVACKNSVKR